MRITRIRIARLERQLDPPFHAAWDTVPRGTAREETFGPVVSIFKFDDPIEGVAMAKDTDHDLAAAVWTSDVRTTWMDLS